MRSSKHNLRGQEVVKMIRRGWKNKQRIFNHPNIKKNIKEARVENVDIIRDSRNIESIINLRAEVRAMKVNKVQVDNSLIIYLWIIKDNSFKQ
jgi:hypothetical protein